MDEMCSINRGMRKIISAVVPSCLIIPLICGNRFGRGGVEYQCQKQRMESRIDEKRYLEREPEVVGVCYLGLGYERS